MKKYVTGILLLFLGCPSAMTAQPVKLKKIMGEAGQQEELMLLSLPAAGKSSTDPVLPRSLQDGELKVVSSRDWTSGFFPGILWYLYEYTGEQKWKEQAQKFTGILEREKTNSTTHDMGFKIWCSFGNGLRLAPDEHYKEVIIQSARTLCTRFNPVAGVIRSWDMSKDKWEDPVIIDNMMNLELLFEATLLSGDSSFYKIAVSHANTTLKNHFRADNSSYHVLDYDTATGRIIKKTTAQGYANESAWARGQAWGFYGFTMCYRFTRDPRYLQQAEKIAAFILNNANMPADLVPYWDYNAPGIPGEEKDASAAAIMASALYELSTFSKKGKAYRQTADKILTSLTTHYRSPVGDNKGFILLHSTGHKPAKSEIDVPIIYADYYYVEALLRSKQSKKKRY
ncbi:MAG: glycoside hydrolase family 88 protein [Chitinophagaceae bacterium]